MPPPTTQGLKDFRNLSAEDALEFIDALKEFFGEPENRVWPRAEKMKDIVVRRRAVLNALEILESKGCTNRRSGGGFLIGDWELGILKLVYSMAGLIGLFDCLQRSMVVTSHGSLLT